tara:strand:+ start:358 stop:1311 length:954 start_codon:yes stop_codon:yes gene_type:complete
MNDFLKEVTSEFKQVNTLILKCLESDVGLVENIGQYIVDAGGKRLRPLVVILSALANNYSGSNHMKMAAVIEFIHTATLLHDDVVDVASLRRGRETANIQWGNAPSVLVGDFLYSRAFQLLVELGDMEIMGIMADATNMISEGEVKQMANIGNPELSEEEYCDVIYRKTAKLFEAASLAGACLANKNREPMKGFGKHLGMAFQITDDILDYFGDVSVTGKSIGGDLSEGKMTLPIIFARDHSSKVNATLIKNAIREKSSKCFDAILCEVKKSGALNYCKNKAEIEVIKAKKCLEMVSPGAYKESLIKLADYSLTRLS